MQNIDFKELSLNFCGFDLNDGKELLEIPKFWEIPVLHDFDERKISIKFEEEKIRMEFKWQDTEKNNFHKNDHLLQGIYLIHDQKREKTSEKIIQFRSEKDNFNVFDAGNSKIVDLAKCMQVAEFYTSPYSEPSNICSWGNIPHRLVRPKYRRLGIANRIFNIFESHLPALKNSFAVIGTQEIKVFRPFLEERGYKLSRRHKFIKDQSYDEFTKDLRSAEIDKTSNYLKYLKFPVMFQGKLYQLTIPTIGE